jgi:predicted SAM-dependent methyltransferase
MSKLNLGCGSRVLQGYLNIDSSSNTPGVISAFVTDLSFLPDKSCDEVIAYYLLEHLTYEQAVSMMYQVSLKLVPGGIFKILVPDFTEIARYAINNNNNIDAMNLLSMEVYINGEESGHKSIWNESILTYYLYREGFFEHAVFTNNVGSKSFGIYVDAYRTEYDHYNTKGGGYKP